MYTIKEAASRTGIPEGSLRAWERRYAIVEPHRSDGGYRLYDEEALATLSLMRGLVESGWAPSAAAEAIRSGNATAAAADSPAAGTPEHARLTADFLRAAAAVDVVAIESVLDSAFALASFEGVVEEWLMPTLVELGRAWERAEVDVVGEHTASHAVMRRLSMAFAAAASVLRGPRVAIGLPAGSHHELGALAFATTARRRGLAVVYLGADLPVASWVRAVRAFPTRAAVLTVPTAGDRDAALETVQTLRKASPDMVVAVGGGASADLDPGVFTLPRSIPAAARTLDRILA